MATITSVFESIQDAREAVAALASAGWAPEQISLVAPGGADAGPATERIALHDTEKGAAIGGIAGLLIGVSEIAVPGVGMVLIGGWIAAAVIGLGIGAVAGGLVGLLAQAGLSYEHAHGLAEHVGQGRTSVVVRAEASAIEQASALLRAHHAVDVQTVGASDQGGEAS